MSKQAGRPGTVDAQQDAGAAEAAEALAGVVQKLRDELAGVRRAMRNRAVIEQAKGVLVAQLGLSPDGAFDQLVELSQRSNIKVAEVAAALVGAAAPAPGDESGRDRLDEQLRQYLAEARRPAAAESPAAEPATEALRAQHQLLAAQISAAAEYPQIAQAIAASSVGWPAPDVVLIALRDPDDRLRPVGAYGAHDPDGGPMADAARAAFADGSPVFRDDASGPRSVLAVPLVSGSQPVGAFAVGWGEPVRLDATARRYLSALADPIGRRTGALAPAELAAGSGQPARQILDGLPVPAALLSAVRDEQGRVVDFRYDETNAAADTALGGLSGPDTTLLCAFPETGSRLLLGEFAAVLAGGAPSRLADVPLYPSSEGQPVVAQISSTRVGDRVLVVWQPASAADLLHDQLLQAERMGRLGSFWWDPRTDEARYTPELFRLLARDANAGALPLSAVDAYVHPDDLPAVRRAVDGAVQDGHGFTVEHRLADAPGRRLRMIGEPEFDADGAVSAVRGTVQDVTEERAVESRLRRAQEALAAQRQRLAAESRAAQTLRDALLPTDPELTSTPGLSVRGLCRSPESTGRVAGDWYDVFWVDTAPGRRTSSVSARRGATSADAPRGAAEPAGGGTYLVVGDVTGSGLTATVAAARLRNAVRAYAALGMAPGELLTTLNRLGAALHVEALATLVVARFDPAAGRLSWAAAGQAAPVRYAPDGHAMVLSGPLGLPIGAAPDMAYEQADLHLAAGEHILLYTDGLVVRRDRTLAAGLDTLLHVAQRARLDPLPDLVDHVTATLDSAPDDDLAVLLATTR